MTHLLAWRWFLELQEHALKKIVFIGLLGAFQSAFVCLIPLLIRERMNNLAGFGDFLDNHVWTISVVTVLYLASTVISLLIKRVGIAFATQQAQTLDNVLIRKLYQISLSEILDQRGKHLHSLMFLERARIDNMFQSLILSIVPAFIIAAILSSVLLVINWQATLAMFFLFPIVKRTTSRTRRNLKQSVENYQVAVEKYNQGLSTSLTLMELTRMSAAENGEIKKRSAELASLSAAHLSMRQIENWLLGQQAFIFSCLSLLIAWLISSDIGRRGALSGDLLSYFVALGLLRTQLATLSGFSLGWYNGNQALGILHRFVRQAPPPSPYKGSAPHAFRGGLRAENISFGYSARDFIRGLSFSLKPGECLVLSGKNGSGKTTLLRLLLGVIPVSSGRLLADEVAYTQIDMPHFRSQVGMAPQDPILFRGTILENILYGVSCAPEAVEEAIAMTGLGPFLASLPAGLNTFVGEHGLQLSGGQRQRIGIARALARRPRLLILDEPSNNLGIEEALKIVTAARKQQPAPTLILVSHDPSFFSLADLHIELNNEGSTPGETALNSPIRTASFIQGPEVTSDIVDGEAILVNLRTGNYYSLTGAGPQIWMALIGRVSVSRIVDGFDAACDADALTIERAIEALVAELLTEGLLVYAEIPEGQGEIPMEEIKPQPFQMPRLEKFSDLQDLLVLDPIHETDPSGWPNRAGDEVRGPLPA